MRQTFPAVLVTVMLVMAAASPLSAANKEHQQLMADIRMLQEQAQLLQNMLGSMTETLKAMDARLDQRIGQLTTSTVKGFADQKSALDNLTNDARVIREKLDDNNVRIGSLTQEVEALRGSMQQMGTRPSSTTEPNAAAPGTAPAGGGASAPGGTPSPPPVTASPTQVWDAANADYMAGQYDLAVLGFEMYIKSFPKSDRADDAQVTICASYLNDNKNEKAVEACDLAIRTYPNGNAIPEAYYRKGLALANLKDVTGARSAWETLVKNYPDSALRTLAQQRLDGLRKP
jgi:TolA-binding protein